MQGSNDIAGYYTIMKGLWDELDILNVQNSYSCDCFCGGKTLSTKSIQDEKLIKFLMGLNDTYSPARSNICMITSLPSASLANSLILQDEKQRELSVNLHFQDILHHSCLLIIILRHRMISEERNLVWLFKLQETMTFSE